MTKKTDKQRRLLLQSAAVGSVAAGAPLVSSASAKPLLDKIQRDEFPTPDFESFLGETVQLKGDTGVHHKATIVEVENLSYECAVHRRPGFLKECATVLRLNVDNIEDFDDQVYQLSHAKLGKHQLMFTVVPNAKGNFGLEAVFN